MKRLVILDGECALCSRVARLIDRGDPSGEIRIATAGTEPGRSLLQRHGLDPDDPLTWLYLEDGVAHAGMAAVIKIAARLSGPVRLLVVLRILPQAWQNGLYALIARNRYRLFGTASLCPTASKTLKARLVMEPGCENPDWRSKIIKKPV